MRDSTLAAFSDDLKLLAELALPACLAGQRFERWFTVSAVMLCMFMLALALRDSPAEAHQVARDPEPCESVARLDPAPFR